MLLTLQIFKKVASMIFNLIIPFLTYQAGSSFTIETILLMKFHKTRHPGVPKSLHNRNKFHHKRN